MSLDQVLAAAEPHIGDESVPGLVALVAHGEEVLVEALGHLSIGGPPVQRDSLFRISSITKPITASVAAESKPYARVTVLELVTAQIEEALHGLGRTPLAMEASL